MAHGMGVPVEDAKTTIFISEPGEYRLWALTRNWSAVWNIENAAGIFEMLIDGKSTGETLGNKSTEWDWQSAGNVYLEKVNIQFLFTI